MESSSWLWPVVPICSNQLLDVDKNDILNNGLYRKCNIYKGGGGYDKFNEIYEKRFNYSPSSFQFVVQLYGCPLKCPYCYVTEQGIFGLPVKVSTDKLIYDYNKSGLEVFHLMGGAPAIYLSKWKYIQDKVKVFHSDFLLIEHEYLEVDLIGLKGLHAVSLKQKSFYNFNNEKLIYKNLEKLIKYNVNFYITFTGKDDFSNELFVKFGSSILDDSFVIPIVEYKSLGGKTNGKQEL